MSERTDTREIAKAIRRKLRNINPAIRVRMKRYSGGASIHIDVPFRGKRATTDGRLTPAAVETARNVEKLATKCVPEDRQVCLQNRTLFIFGHLVEQEASR